MNKKDLFDSEIKKIFQEDASYIELSAKLIENIVNSREKTWRSKLDDFLNKEIEIPLAPAIIGFAALIIVFIIPKDILKNQQTSVINIGSSQVFIR